ncbi:MAG: SH3 domain-containing protein [Anaerolineales bacterium]|nr:SH3 domain-containing protein [Anaerolineales bacterium]
MPNHGHAGSHQDQVIGDQISGSASSLDNLRQILFHEQIEKIEDVEAGLEELERRINDERALVKMIAPVLGEAIRLKIREARDELIEALYPIIGQVVQRAVTEAVRDLARTLDTQVKRSFDFRLAWWRLRARISGASEAQIRLREMLPFTITDILLIHRETGLLLCHLRSDQSVATDTDLISGMLTAIRDFSQDTLGSVDQEGVGEIMHGNQRILMETALYTYLAVIVDGIEPAGFRAEMRERLMEIEHNYADEIRGYQGDSQTLTGVEEPLRTLMSASAGQKLSEGQKRVLAGAAGALLVVLVVSCLAISWVWRLGAASAERRAAAIPPSATMTSVPTETRTPLPSPTPSPKATVTYTPTAIPSATVTARPAPVVGVMIGNVWLRSAPSYDAARVGVILNTGDQVEILSRSGEWIYVRRISAGQIEVTGWLPARWIVAPTLLTTPGAQP